MGIGSLTQLCPVLADLVADVSNQDDYIRSSGFSEILQFDWLIDRQQASRSRVYSTFSSQLGCSWCCCRRAFHSVSLIKWLWCQINVQISCEYINGILMCFCRESLRSVTTIFGERRVSIVGSQNIVMTDLIPRFPALGIQRLLVEQQHTPSFTHFLI